MHNKGAIMMTIQTYSKKIAATLLTLAAITTTQATEILKPVPMNTAEITKAAQLNIAQSFATNTIKTQLVKAKVNTLFAKAEKAEAQNSAATKSAIIAE